MIEEPDMLIQDFVRTYNEHYEEEIDSDMISHQLLKAPHKPQGLPRGKCAVYVFSLSETSKAPAGKNRVLKVGKVGPNSNARFLSQHYNVNSAPSNLASSIDNNRILWRYLNIEDDTADFGSWLKSNTDRDHFFLDASRKHILAYLEAFLKGHLGPVFEGSCVIKPKFRSLFATDIVEKARERLREYGYEESTEES